MRCYIGGLRKRLIEATEDSYSASTDTIQNPEKPLLGQSCIEEYIALAVDSFYHSLPAGQLQRVVQILTHCVPHNSTDMPVTGHFIRNPSSSAGERPCSFVDAQFEF